MTSLLFSISQYNVCTDFYTILYQITIFVVIMILIPDINMDDTSR
mgnify:CR=1 FL=1